MSGTLPLARLMGDLVVSSAFRYFSFWRRTLETVLKLILDHVLPFISGDDSTFFPRQTKLVIILAKVH